MTHSLKVEVDRDLCIGSGDCERRAPTVFTVDDEGLAVVLDPSSVDEETLRSAAASCPSGAISIVE
jgi:ferredoxin